MAFEKFVTLEQKFQNLDAQLDRIIEDLDYLIETPERKEQEARAEEAALWILEKADKAGVFPEHVLEEVYPNLTPDFVRLIKMSLPWVSRYGI